MDEKRNFKRFPVGLNAKCVGGGNNEGRECKVINIGRNGMAIELYLKEKTDIASSLELEIDFPGRIKPINSQVVLKWITELKDETEFNFVAGGELKIIAPDDKECLLDYGFENWKRQEEEKIIAQTLDITETVTEEELLRSNSRKLEVLISLLVKKGIVSRDEFMQAYKQLIKEASEKQEKDGDVIE